MNTSIETISLINLSIILIPVALVMGIFLYWSLSIKSTLNGIFRMLLQLILIGYFLNAIFESKSAWVVAGVLSVMLCAACWIALRTVEQQRKQLYLKAFVAIFVATSVNLFLVTQGVLKLDPWYSPQYLIPLAGMIFSSAMNSVSLAAERFFSELKRGEPEIKARNIAFEAALIPVVNSLFAVGLVSLPGMMTGQILSGVSPLIAARYQIMVMCMLFSAAGLAAALFLFLLLKHHRAKNTA